MTRSALCLFAATVTLALSHLASAAEVKVYSTIGVKSALENWFRNLRRRLATRLPLVGD